MRKKEVHAIAFRPYQLDTYIEGASLMQWESIDSQQLLHGMSFPHELSHLADLFIVLLPLRNNRGLDSLGN
jgi:hypothetical protein